MSPPKLSPRKDVRDLVESVKARGWTVEHRPGRHIKLISPSGAIVTIGATPSDRRAHLNNLARIKRIDPDFEK